MSETAPVTGQFSFFQRAEVAFDAVGDGVNDGDLDVISAPEPGAIEEQVVFQERHTLCHSADDLSPCL